MRAQSPESAPAPAASVLKDEPSTRVERILHGAEAAVAKTYRNRGLRLLQTFGRRSRAAREHANLRAVSAAGLPCTEPIEWSERRIAGFVTQSRLVTRFVEDCATVKHWLRELPPGDRRRARLSAAMGELLASMHERGMLWCAPMPRNFLLQGEPEVGRLLICDVPALVRFRGSIRGKAAGLIDLFDAAASRSRRGDLSRAERMRFLRSYARGDRGLARRLFCRLARTTELGHGVHKNLVMAFRTYILGAFRRRSAEPDA
ncbi:MAG: hypothetical protein Fur0037_12620 [Planctomycetota bacterium]